MARPSLADLPDLENLLGESVADPPRAMLLLAHASEVVRAYAGTTWLNEAETAVEAVPEQIPTIVAVIVERATRNPMGITQEAAGPFSRSFGADAAQRIYMTKQERAIVRAAVGVAAVGPLATTRGNLETADVRRCGGLYDPPIEETDPFSLT